VGFGRIAVSEIVGRTANAVIAIPAPKNVICGVCFDMIGPICKSHSLGPSHIEVHPASRKRRGEISRAPERVSGGQSPREGRAPAMPAYSLLMPSAFILSSAACNLKRPGRFTAVPDGSLRVASSARVLQTIHCDTVQSRGG
jgi:hypothetical protein